MQVRGDRFRGSTLTVALVALRGWVVWTVSLEAERTATDPTVDVAYHAALGSTAMAKRSKRKAASPLERETERLTPAPPGRKRPKLGPDRSPQRDPRKTPAKE